MGKQVIGVPLVRLAGPEDAPLLVVGPSLGTSVEALWGRAARDLGSDFQVVGWDLPGHGRAAATTTPFTMRDLSTAVLDAVEKAFGPVPFAYAGDSVGGAVGLQLALDAPERVRSVVALCTGAVIGTPDSWTERAATVRTSGTPAVVEASARRWFGPGFLDREPETGAALLDSLQHADPESYALVAEALGRFDLRPHLPRIQVPVLAVAGEHDTSTPTEALREHASHIPGAIFVRLRGIAHLAPAEAPGTVATLVHGHVAGEALKVGTVVRRQVLGDEHVDRAQAATTELTADFQRFIGTYAWGGIWTRPGLAPRDRSIAVLTALVAGRHFEELEFHLRAALRNGLTRTEIVEVLLQSAVYVGVPAANTAFAVAARVLGDD